MPRWILTLSILAAVLIPEPLAGARHEAWVEVRSPNFVIVSDAGEKQARKFAIQFEQIREVFRQSLVVANAHPSPVITVLAAKDETTMRELLPEYWEKGRSHVAGIFEHQMEMWCAAVQIDAPGDNPYHTMYHEYYHSLTIPFYPGLPLWLAEGLADFYGNTLVAGEYTTTGRPDPNLIYELRNSRPIPLDVLFKVDQKSPYYTQEGKTSIFYAESWALTHYLMVGDREAHRPMLKAYLDELSKGASQDEAAAKAFGDPRKLQETLMSYISRFSFMALQMKSLPKVSESQLTSRPLSEAEAETHRAGLFLLRGRAADAKPMLEDALKSDPHIALAHEYLALADFYGGQREEAGSEASKAIALEPNAGMARYLRASLTFREGLATGNRQIEEDLRAAVASMPNFGPSYALLAVVLAANNENLNEALAMAQKAVSLQPANANFQLGLAEVLAHMGKYDDAHLAGLRALEWTREPEERTSALSFLTALQTMRQYAPNGLQPARAAAVAAAEGKTIDVTGIVSNLKCDGAMEFDVTSVAGTVDLRVAPSIPVKFVVPGAQPNQSDLCASLDGRNVTVRYVSDKDNDDSGALQMLQVLLPEKPPEDIMRGHAPADAVVATVEGTTMKVSCEANEMLLTMSVNGTSITLHAKDFTHVVFTANSRQAMGDLSPCTDLKDRPLKVGFIPNHQKNSAGEIQAIIIEK
jgi:tetratricopeptide (TPR) repeat protein